MVRPLSKSGPDSENARDGHSRHGPLRGRRGWLFRFVAASVPTVFGLTGIVALLVHQERLVADPQSGWWKLQRPPHYLYESDHETSGHKYLYDPVLGWRNIPNWSATTKGQPLTINSQGLRGRDFDYDKEPGASRILVLGDSFTWGYGVADEDVLTVGLERRLAASRQNWRILNTGVSGWGTDQEYLFLVNEGFKYSPDIVVLLLYIANDPMNNSFSIQYGLQKPLFMDLDLKICIHPGPIPRKRKVVNSPFHPYALTATIIQHMEQRCVEQACRFVVVKFGDLWFTPQEREQAIEASRYFVEQLGPRIEAPFLDLDKRYLEAGLTFEDLTEGNDDGHWNALGHEKTAEFIYQFLIEQGLVGTGSARE